MLAGGILASDGQPMTPLALVPPADAVTNLIRGLRESRAHDSDEIGLNLKIDVVGMRIVHPVARFGRHDPVEDIIPRGLVGMPELIIVPGKGNGKRISQTGMHCDDARS